MTRGHIGVLSPEKIETLFQDVVDHFVILRLSNCLSILGLLLRGCHEMGICHVAVTMMISGIIRLVVFKMNGFLINTNKVFLMALSILPPSNGIISQTVWYLRRHRTLSKNVWSSTHGEDFT